LLWAYIAFVVFRAQRGATKHELVLCFSAKEQISVRIANKNTGLNTLSMLKKLNPNILVGFNQSFRNMFENDFDGFKDRILSDMESMQGITTAEHLATMESRFIGFGREHID